MRRANIMMLVVAAALVVGSLFLHRLDSSVSEKRYYQHLEEPSEEQLAKLDPTGAPSVGTKDLCTHLPILRIETKGQTIPGRPYADAEGNVVGYEKGDNGEEVIPVTFSTVEAPNVWHRADDPASIEGTATFRIRGNSSRWFSKPGYLLSVTADYEATADAEAELLGMPAGTKWSLHGPFLDKTLMRNYLCLNLAGEVMDEWVPRVRFCELLIDGEYQGVYAAIEMVEVQKNRLHLAEYRPGNATSSYVVRIEVDNGSVRAIDTFGDYARRIESGRMVELMYPGARWQSEQVRSYVTLNYSEVERKIYGGDVGGWKDSLDLNNLIDNYLLNEFFANNDLFSASTYFFRDARGKLSIGPVWDFNNAFDNFFLPMPEKDFLLSQRGWYAMLFRDEEFTNLVIARWRELRANKLSDERLMRLVDETHSWLGSAIDRNYAKWDNAFDLDSLSRRERRRPDNGSDGSLEESNPTSYDEALEWMKDYMLGRANWMDEHVETLRQHCHPSKLH